MNWPEIEEIIYSDGVSGTVLNYSLKSYFQNILNKAATLDPKAVAMVKTLMNYGGYLQKYCGEPDEKLINKDLGMPLDDVTVDISDDYKAVVANGGKKIKAKGANIAVGSLIKMNVKFTLAEGAKISDYKFTVNGKTARAVKDGAVYVVSCEGISPLDFGEMYVVRAESVSDPADFAEVHYSVYTYAKSILQKNADNDLKNVLKAIVQYGEAVKAYHEN